MQLEPFIEIGKVIKTKNFDGTLLIDLYGNYVDSVYKCGFIFLEINGLPTPFEIVHIEMIDGDNHLIKLEELRSKEEAQQYNGEPIFIPQKDIIVDHKTTDQKPSDIRGFLLIDKTSGREGIISKIQENAFQLLLQISIENNDYLVPYHDDFLVDIDPSIPSITLELPEGIWDL